MHVHEHDPEGPEAARSSAPRRDGESLGALPAVLSGVPEAVSPQAILGLQRTAGNATVAQLLAGGEHEDSEDYGVGDVVGGGGHALDDATRTTMEQGLGADFGDVRIHTDGSASKSAEQLGAHAYTVGNDIAFQSGKYNPGTADGQRMLAHELTHVVQQRSGPVSGEPIGGGVAVSHPSDRFEREAERTADEVMRSVDTGAVQRQPEEEELQMSAVQREGDEPEEEELQMSAVQREGDEPEEEELQMSAVQREATDEVEDEEIA